jgi:hypothetical protein
MLASLHDTSCVSRAVFVTVTFWGCFLSWGQRCSQAVIATARSMLERVSSNREFVEVAY